MNGHIAVGFELNTVAMGLVNLPCFHYSHDSICQFGERLGSHLTVHLRWANRRKRTPNPGGGGTKHKAALGPRFLTINAESVISPTLDEPKCHQGI
jgi:hypothetical protein